jgi:hypothetical protein
MDIAFEILELFTVPKVPDDIGVIFKFFYAPVNNIWAVTSKHSELTRMHAEPYVPSTSFVTNLCEVSFQIAPYIR